MYWQSAVVACSCWTILSGVVSAEIQQQAFRITPNDVEARTGEEVVLRCEVEHLAGRVQWTKDGFALGFANDIVGYPRFSLNQNHSAGVYNLRITNTSLDDTASYQCQVGPAKHNRPIRAAAKLTILGLGKSHRGLHHRN
ncbi:irregular chiasm C-roughest protein-like [Topomyia yanbarensis]|uniref:irregular chiasm C-roughest protein-like n=1 Tax=Topomyia yanbarensis TaxID=2498891 RepID=UPI00273B8014|nr:irregular chiasm C-roughest protein-like [Topomyia yanbarensis]